MFANLLKHSVRSFKRQRAYVIINVLGLSIGITCSLFIALYVINEASYDKFNTKKDQIYRINLSMNLEGMEDNLYASPAIIGPTMAKEFPEVESFLRLNRVFPVDVTYNKQFYTENHIIQADSTFFDFFSIPVLKGNPHTLLNGPHKVVLSKAAAKKYFNNDDPIDKVLKIGTDTIGFTVSGIMDNIPANSHFDADMIYSFMTNPESNEPIWMSASFSTYLLLKPNSDFNTVNKKLPDFVNGHIAPEIQKFMGISFSDFTAKGNKVNFYLQNLKDIHLDPSVKQQFKDAGNPKYMTILGTLALLIVIIAAINFMNLSTAQASRRSKEVGIKKAGGSTRSLLVFQFMTESVILSFVSLVISLIIIKIALPYYNDLISANLVFNLFDHWYIIPLLILFTIIVGLISGSYPALYLSSFNPYEVLKGGVKKSFQNGLLRRVLVVFQFSVSLVLIIGTIIMFRQIKFMLNKDLGFNKDEIMVIQNSDILGTAINSFKETVRGIPGVQSIVSSTAVPGRGNLTSSCRLEGEKTEMHDMEINYIDYGYLETYGIKLVDGRDFNKSFTTDQQACLVNESAVKNLGITNLEKTRFSTPGDPMGNNYLQTIGVVKNFNFRSLHYKIEPYLFCLRKADQGGYLSIKMSKGTSLKTIGLIESKWKEFNAVKALDYYFVDKDYEQMYIAEKQNARMAVLFSLLAILIASLGLFGLTSFTIEARTKEIGVRKAMGSTLHGVCFEISKEVMILVSVSAIIAWPVIYFVAKNWLAGFYYKTPLNAMSFIDGLAIAMLIAVITIGYRVIKAAGVNPAVSLKFE